MKIANVLLDFDNENNQDYIEKSFIDYALYLTIKECNVFSIYKKNILESFRNINISNRFLKNLIIKFLELYSLFSLWVDLIKFDCEIAICHSFKSLFFIKSARFFSENKFKIVLICDNFPTKKICVDYIITHYSSMIKDLVSLGIKREKISVINHAIEYEKNFLPPLKKNFSKPLIIGSFGNISSNLNFDKVLKAIHYLQSKNIECEYIIAGSGDDEDRLNLLAIELQIKDKFKIIKMPKNKLDFYNQIDICIMPFDKYTFSNILLEPMLFNIPIITSKTYHTDEILENNLHGLKISIDDEELIFELIANSIEKILNDESESKQMAKRAYYKILDQHNSQLVSNKIFYICREVIKSSEISNF